MVSRRTAPGSVQSKRSALPNRTMKPDRIRHLPSYLWVLVGPGLIVLAYLIGLALFDLLGAGYLRSFARRLFGL